jgi:hypothetical protein
MSTLQGILKELQEQFTDKPKESTAQKIMDEYFSYVNANHVQEQLWELTIGTITNELMDTQTGADRHNLIFFYEYTRLFFNAVYFLHCKK